MELRFTTHDDQILVIEGNNGGYVKLTVLDPEGVNRRSEVLLSENDMHRLQAGMEMFA